MSALKFFALHPFLFRVVRLLELLHGGHQAVNSKSSNEVQAVLVAMLKAVYMLATLLFLLLFLTFIFSVAGIQLFGNLCTHSDLELEPRVALRCQLTDPSMIMPDQYNFKTIPTSILLLWRFILVDGWTDLVRTYSTSQGLRAPGSLEAVAALLSQHAFEVNNNLLMHVPMNASATDGANQIKLLEYMPTLLPGCITTSELNFLQEQKLIRCPGGLCDTTCGSWLGYFFFPFFIVCSVVVLLNMIAASLLKCYNEALGRTRLSAFVPGSQEPCTTLCTLFRSSN
jgi:hypothetical protein